jgi:hypothetical protein
MKLDPLTATEQHRLSVENKVLRRIHEPKKGEVQGVRRKLYNEKQYCYGD